MYCGFNFEDALGFNTFLNLHPGQLALISSFLSPKHNQSTENQTRNYKNTILFAVRYLNYIACTIAHSLWAFSYYDCIPYSLYSGPMSPHTLVTSLDKKFTLFIESII